MALKITRRVSRDRLQVLSAAISAAIIVLTAASTGANLNAATQGAVDIWLLVASTL